MSDENINNNLNSGLKITIWHFYDPAIDSIDVPMSKQLVDGDPGNIK